MKRSLSLLLCLILLFGCALPAEAAYTREDWYEMGLKALAEMTPEQRRVYRAALQRLKPDGRTLSGGGRFRVLAALTELVTRDELVRISEGVCCDAVYFLEGEEPDNGTN